MHGRRGEQMGAADPPVHQAESLGRPERNDQDLKSLSGNMGEGPFRHR